VANADQSIQILKLGFEAFSSGDIERVLEITHRDFLGVVPPELSAEPDSYRGHDGIRRYFESFAEAVDELRFEADRFWPAGQDTLVASVRMTGRGRHTSIPIEQRNAHLWTLRDGKLFRVITYASLPAALEAAGLDADAEHAAD
jgi:uncharacterized protein